jgi:hypothetical protein
MSIPPLASAILIPAATVASLSFVPSSAMAAVTGPINSVVGGALGSLPQNLPYFFTVPFANNQSVLYKLQIDLGTGGVGPAGNPDPFIFPLTPNNVSKQSINLTNYYDVASTNPDQFGVQRIIDNFGLTPPIITISGTTGFQFHSLDNYQWSGKSSFAQLVKYIQQYNSLVVNNVSSGQSAGPLPRMIFTDGFTNESFDVVPFGNQGYAMDAGRPIYQTYNLQFIARLSTSPTSVNISDEDPIAQAFILGKALLTAGLLSYVNQFFLSLPGSNIT